jgi:hypothetical protein
VREAHRVIAAHIDASSVRVRRALIGHRAAHGGLSAGDG